LAAARSDTGCSTVLIPWVEEPVMVTPEVVGHIDPAGLPGLKIFKCEGYTSGDGDASCAMPEP
jgi:hypothetical protein